LFQPRKTALCLLLLAGLCAPAWGQGASAVRSVRVLGSKDAVEIEIEASDRLVPQTRVLTGPDRLVIDFPNATPGNQLRSQSVNRGEVKDVRVGLFQSKPPITRVVLDLNAPQSFQVFPNGRTVMIKVTGGARPVQDASTEVSDFPAVTRRGLVTTNYTPGAARISTEILAQPKLEVTFRNGLLAIKSNKASLSEIMFAVHQRTGAEVSVAAGAEQEQVAADIGPAPAPEVLARLLNGSKFNFLILSSASDPHGLDRVILSPKAEGGVMPLPPLQSGSDDSADDDTPQRVEPPVATVPPPANVPPPVGHQLGPVSPPEMKAPPDDNNPPD
jgi:hypothetical protein